MKALLNDLGLRHRRDVLKDILENALPATLQDVVVIFVTVSGRLKGGRLLQESYANKIYSRQIGGVMRSAIQITTASGICAVLDLLARASCRRRASSARRTSRSTPSSPTASAAPMPGPPRRLSPESREAYSPLPRKRAEIRGRMNGSGLANTRTHATK
jgi:hypothetical protein